MPSNRQNPFRQIYDSEDFKNARILKSAQKPFLVDIELTNHCNLLCKMCARRLMTRKRGYMAREIFDKVLEDCKAMKTPIRFIRWGEPFMHRDIIKYAKAVKDAGLLLHITNNGLKINEKQMRELIEMGLDSIIFSMQGATKEGYEEMRNNRHYDDLVKNIFLFARLRAGKEKPFMHISSTMTNETKEEIDKFRQFWSVIADSVDVGKTSFIRFRNEETKEITPCNEIWTKLSVDWDGKVTACCGDYDNLLVVGDINQESLLEIWNGKKLKAIRQLLDDNMYKSLTLCSKCEHAYSKF